MDAGKIIFEELNKWVYNETNEAGEKLHVIDASDLHEIIPEIVKKLNKPAVSVNEVKVCPICGVPFYYLYNKDYYQQECECDLSGQT